MFFEKEYDAAYNIYFICVLGKGEQYTMTYHKSSQLLSCGCGTPKCQHKKDFKATFPKLFRLTTKIK